MQLWELFLIAVGLSADAFAVAVCKGLSVGEIKPRHGIITGLYFGGFQGLMPLIGYYLGERFKSAIEDFDHWIAFALLCLIGINMIREASDRGDEKLDCSFSPSSMIPLAVATSIDALIVGVTFALSYSMSNARANFSFVFIGTCTFALSWLGVVIGNKFGAKYKSNAEFAGGVVLVLMGIKILLEHLGVIA